MHFEEPADQVYVDSCPNRVLLRQEPATDREGTGLVLRRAAEREPYFGRIVWTAVSLFVFSRIPRLLRWDYSSWTDLPGLLYTDTLIVLVMTFFALTPLLIGGGMFLHAHELIIDPDRREVRLHRHGFLYWFSYWTTIPAHNLQSVRLVLLPAKGGRIPCDIEFRHRTERNRPRHLKVAFLMDEIQNKDHAAILLGKVAAAIGWDTDPAVTRNDPLHFELGIAASAIPGAATVKATANTPAIKDVEKAGTKKDIAADQLVTPPFEPKGFAGHPDISIWEPGRFIQIDNKREVDSQLPFVRFVEGLARNLLGASIGQVESTEFDWITQRVTIVRGANVHTMPFVAIEKVLLRGNRDVGSRNSFGTTVELLIGRQSVVLARTTSSGKNGSGEKAYEMALPLAGALAKALNVPFQWLGFPPR